MLKKDSVISCPSCQTSQIKSTKDLEPGSQLKEAGFVSLGFDMEGPNAGCYKCSTPFIREHPVLDERQLHTEEKGWVTLSKKRTSKLIIT